ncbi:MAG: hypothetical protein HQM15_09430 [Deltaproteobacteria bacterium]|nr:hypothetical protein [Deltaproteobacteria bacterium]
MLTTHRLDPRVPGGIQLTLPRLLQGDAAPERNAHPNPETQAAVQNVNTDEARRLAAPPPQRGAHALWTVPLQTVAAPSTSMSPPTPTDTRHFIPIAIFATLDPGANFVSFIPIVGDSLTALTDTHQPSVRAGVCALVYGVPLCLAGAGQSTIFGGLRETLNLTGSPDRTMAGQTQQVYNSGSIDLTMASRGPRVNIFGDPDASGAAFYWGRPVTELGLRLSLGQFAGGNPRQPHEMLVGLGIVNTMTNFFDSVTLEAPVLGVRFALTASLFDSSVQQIYGSRGAAVIGDPNRREGDDVSPGASAGPSFTITWLPNHGSFSRDRGAHPLTASELLTYFGAGASLYFGNDVHGVRAVDSAYAPPIPGQVSTARLLGFADGVMAGAQTGVFAGLFEDVLRRGNLGQILGASAGYMLLSALQLYPAAADAQWSVAVPPSRHAGAASLNYETTLITGGLAGGLALLSATVPALERPGDWDFHFVNAAIAATGAVLLGIGIGHLPHHPLDLDDPLAVRTALAGFGPAEQLQYRADLMGAFQMGNLGAGILSYACTRWVLSSGWGPLTTPIAHQTTDVAPAAQRTGLTSIAVTANGQGASVLVGFRL